MEKESFHFGMESSFFGRAGTTKDGWNRQEGSLARSSVTKSVTPAADGSGRDQQ
jgi:hypothetical protein